MGWLKSEKPPRKYDNAYVKMLVERIRTSVNFLDETNFPNGIEGSIIKAKTLPLSAIAQGEWHIPIISLATAYTTTSTSLVNVGPYAYWSPIAWGSGHKGYLEVTGGSVDPSATATFELHGVNGKIAECTSNSGSYEWLRSESFDLPSQAQTLLLKMKTSNASYSAGILGAKIIIIP